ncbi:MAG: hypothetical protein V3V46_04750 [Anaerolineales bacterium]
MRTSGTRQAAVIGGLMVLFGALLLIQEFVEISAWIWAAVLVASGLGVYGIYSVARDEVWMVIVSYVLLAIGFMMALVTADILEDSFIAAYVLSAIAIPFIYAYFRSGRETWGFLIPAYVLIAVGVMVPLIETGVLADNSVPIYIMFAVALPFLVVFVRNTKQWWALIVGGITALVGLSFLVASDLVEYVTPVALILIGGGILMRLVTRREVEETSQDPVSDT